MRALLPRVALASLLLATVLAACGAGATTSPAAPTESTPAATAVPAPTAPAVCADAAAFRAAVAALRDLKPLEVGTSGVKAALADVESSAQALVASGKDLLGPPLTDLVTAIAGLRTTLTSLGDQEGLAPAIVAIRSAIADIADAAAKVEEALAVSCPAQ